MQNDIQQHPYSVSGVKSFRGREGYGFNAHLHRDGRKVAFVIDEANGGEYRYEWLAKDRAQAMSDEQALADYCKTLPEIDLGGTVVNGAGVMMPQGPDMFVGSLVDEAEYAQRVARSLKVQLKKRVLFEVGGKLMQSKAGPSPEVIARIAAAHAGAVILNTLPPAEALARYRQHAVAA